MTAEETEQEHNMRWNNRKRTDMQRRDLIAPSQNFINWDDNYRLNELIVSTLEKYKLKQLNTPPLKII